MEYRIYTSNGKELAEILSGNFIIKSPQDLLDIMTRVKTSTLIFKKEMLPEAFFDLKSGLAGDIMQKIGNYRLKMAVVGDFSGYASTSLRDFIRECNRSNNVVFVDDVNTAIQKLSL